MTQAQRNEIQNRQLWANTYFEMRDEPGGRRGRARAEAFDGADRAVRTRRRAAKLTPSQVDPVSGRLNWPVALQTESFAAPRTEVDGLFSKYLLKAAWTMPTRARSAKRLTACSTI